MSLIVQKYGGTSVADPERMRNVARHIAATRAAGHDVIVVVSAMGKATDNLLQLAHQVSSNPPSREMDMLLTPVSASAWPCCAWHCTMSESTL